MASRINAAFGHLHRSLLKETVEDGLSIAGIIEDFKLPEPDQPKLTDLLNNIAIGTVLHHHLRASLTYNQVRLSSALYSVLHLEVLLCLECFH